MGPVQLEPSFREKLWGSTRLAPWYPDSDVKIGEIWFEAEPPLPLLLKLLFTEDALSVQVHPGDEYARRHENSPGKTEMWHVLRADPGAKIAMGLREEVSRERLRAAAESGEIEQMLNWVEVKPGDTFQIPAGTIHAIGAGLVLCEIQQNSDITYRLYDYGRPRELHLDKGLEVSTPGPWHRQTPPDGLLVECPYYATRLVAVKQAEEHTPNPSRLELMMMIEGRGTMAGQAFQAGQTWYVPAGSGPFEIVPEGEARFLLTYVPAPAAERTKAGDQFNRLVEIMAQLRAPGGCPWDREQTFDSIKPYTLEETYEVLDAIDARDWPHLAEELGDYMLQAVFYAQMAAERNLFTVEDALAAINNKLVRRHPHVFGEGVAKTAGEVKQRWDEIKKDEQAERGEARHNLLDGVSRKQPALAEAQQVASKAAATGFDWENIDQVFEKMHEELDELRRARESGRQDHIEDEFGDILFVLVNVARFLKVDPEQALRRTNAKFRQRFNFVEDRLRELGKALTDSNIEEMEALWQQAKQVR